MKAFLIATGTPAIDGNPENAYSAPLLPVLNRPMIQHVLEIAVARGINEFDVVLCQAPETFKQLLEDGSRWGVRLNYHVVKDASKPYRPLGYVNAGDAGDPVLLIHADRLVQAEFKDRNQAMATSGPVLYMISESGAPPATESAWSGWAWLNAGCRNNLPGDLDEKALEAYLTALPECEKIVVPSAKSLRVQSYADLLAANQAVLSKRITGLLSAGREIEPGIWLSRNVQLHPTAQIEPPVYIGENSRIDQGVHLGPATVVGDDCVIDAKSSISNSVVFAKSYIGEALELRDSLVDRNRLINVRLGSEVTITEDFLLGSLSEKNISEWIRKILSQMTAAGLILLLFPLFVVLMIGLKLFRGKGPWIFRRDKIRIPAHPDQALWRPYPFFSLCRNTAVETAVESKGHGLMRRIAEYPVGWRDFFLRFLPALINVARGELRFVGVTPRNIQEIEALSHDVRSIYLKSKAGIVSDAHINFGPEPTADELYVSETFYAVSSGLAYDLKLLGKYFGQLLGLVPKATSPHRRFHAGEPPVR